MLAHLQGGLLNQAQLAASLGVSAPAIGRYVDLLVDLRLVRRLLPWSGNVGKRLVKSPKVYVRDSGLVHALLELPSLEALLGHPVVGASWEGMVLEQLIVAAGVRWRPGFYRSQGGAEIDLLLESAGGPALAIEVKRSSDPAVPRGFVSACESLGLQQRYIVYSGQERFPLRHGITAISLADLAALLAAGELPSPHS
jgi:predicted AAA+ superfamily ATPase